MQWDLPHHQGAAFPSLILRQVGAYSILTSLCQDPHLRPKDLMNRLSEANISAEPLIGMRDLSEGISGLLSSLRKQGLIVRCVYAGLGSRTRYEITKLGAELVGALGPLTDWAMSDFDFVVAATRIRFDLPPLDGPVPEADRDDQLATGMALGLLGGGMWSNPVMVYVDSAGPDGIGPQDLMDTINADLAKTAGRERVVRTLQKQALHKTLKRLVALDLIEWAADDPPHVRYRLSPHGQGLMGAWWQIANDWGIGHIPELLPIVIAASNWFERTSGG